MIVLGWTLLVLACLVLILAFIGGLWNIHDEYHRTARLASESRHLERRLEKLLDRMEKL